MHCKFLVFLLIVFLFFSFFLGACEFRLTERIGAHGKKKSRFYYIIIITVMVDQPVNENHIVSSTGTAMGTKDNSVPQRPKVPYITWTLW